MWKMVNRKKKKKERVKEGIKMEEGGVGLSGLENKKGRG